MTSLTLVLFLAANVLLSVAVMTAKAQLSGQWLCCERDNAAREFPQLFHDPPERCVPTNIGGTVH